MKKDNSTKQSNASKPMLANRLFKYRFWDTKTRHLYPVMTLEEVSKKMTVDDFLIPMQFTGLKDKNRKEIYEGDILTYNGITSNGNKIIREVNYNSENARFQSGMYLLTQSIELSEIIGNIYENPELLQTTS